MAKKIKNKTHKGAVKRFKVTATGKLLHRSPTLRHLRSSKTKRQIRQLKKLKLVQGRYAKKLQKLLGRA